MQINISSQLMKNYESGSSVSGDREITTAIDENGDVMFFSIGSDDHLYFFKKDPGTPTGWKRTDLSADIGTGIVTTQIATALDKDGKPILAAVVYDTQYRNNPKVYFTKNFSTEATPDRWISRGNQPNVEITNIATGADKNGNTLIVLSTQQGNKMVNYLVNPDVNDKSWLWKEIPVPLNGKGVIDLAIGHNRKFEQIDGVDALLYTLLRIDEQTTKVVLTSLPDFTVYNHLIPIAFNPTALSIISDRRGNSELFLATNRLYHLDLQAQMTKDPAQLTDKAIAVGSKAFPHTAKKIINGRYASSALEAWVLTEDGNLYFTQEKSGSWLEPYPLDKELGQITGWRNSSSNEIDLFVVDINNQLHHLWQDLTTTRWKDQPIMLGGVNNAIEYDSYTSQITVTDDNQFPLANQEFTVKASELTSVKINGNKYFVDPVADAVTCKTDSTGRIVIVSKVSSMVSPIVRVEAAFLNKAIDLNPNKHIEKRLAAMTPDDLKNARMQTDRDGVTEPLLKNPDKYDLNGTHQAIQELVKLQTTLPSKQGDINATIPQADLNQEGVIVADKSAPVSHQINFAAIPDGYSWGLDVSGSSPVFSNQKDHIQANYLATYQEKLTTPKASRGGIFQDIEQAFGDVWRAIEKGFLTVTHFVIEKIEEGIKIVINGIEDAVHVIVQFAEQVWDVIKLVFEKIGVFFKDLIRWLGFIFNWQDILHTHDVMRSMANLTFTHLIAQADKLEDKIKETFVEVREKLVGKTLNFDRSNEIFSRRPKESMKGQDTSLLSNPKTQWAQHTLTNNLGSATSEAVDIVGELGEVLLNTLKTEGAIIENAVQEVLKDIIDQIDRLSFGEILEKLAVIIAETLINSVENIALSFVEVAEIVARAVWKILNARWDIPLITPLYEEVIAPGSKLTLLDLGCLISAIPATIIYKIVNDKTPFTQEQAKAFSEAEDFSQMLQLLGLDNQSSTTPMVARSIPAVTARARLVNFVAGVGGENAVAAPTITKISPTQGIAGTIVTITGTHLTGATAVTFHENQKANITQNSDTEIKVAVPDGVTAGPISVTTPGGTTASSESFYDKTAIERANIQSGLGFLSVATRLGAAICYDLMELSDFTDNKPAKQSAQSAKFVFDIVTYCFSLANATIYYATTKEITPRRAIDISLQYAQLLPRIKDGIQVVYWHKNGSEYPEKLTLAWFETIFGAISLILVSLSTGLQAQEDPSPVSSDDAITLLSLKGTQNLSASLYQVLSGPKSAITSKEPTILTLKAFLIGFRGFIVTQVVPFCTLTRAILNQKAKRQFLDAGSN